MKHALAATVASLALAAMALASMPSTVPSTAPTTAAATGPATRSAMLRMFHGTAGDWCQLCAAALERQAERPRAAGDGVMPAEEPDLMTDLPPR